MLSAYNSQYFFNFSSGMINLNTYATNFPRAATGLKYLTDFII